MNILQILKRFCQLHFKYILFYIYLRRGGLCHSVDVYVLHYRHLFPGIHVPVCTIINVKMQTFG